jgi:hypothetical protein
LVYAPEAQRTFDKRDAERKFLTLLRVAVIQAGGEEPARTTRHADSSRGLGPLAYRLAIHEAGHAVIARVLTLAAGQATIVADYDDMSAGHHITYDPYDCLHEWEIRGKVPRGEYEAVWRARIITWMAGAEAEREIVGVEPRGDDDDRYQIALMMDSELASPDSPEGVRIEANLDCGKWRECSYAATGSASSVSRWHSASTRH